MQTTPMIVITGGPCAGRSTLLSRSKRVLIEHGYQVFVLPEVVSELGLSGFTSTVTELLGFQREAVSCQLERERRFQSLVRHSLVAKKVMLCDRGVPDLQVYMGSDAYKRMLQSFTYTRDEIFGHYALVVHLVSASVGSESWYTPGDIFGRLCGADDAKAFDDMVLGAWLGHPRHIVVGNTVGFEEKMRRAFKAICRALDVPTSPKRKRKRIFQLVNFSLDSIPVSSVVVDADYTYLTPLPNTSTIQRMVLRVASGLGVSWHYAEQVKADDLGTYCERETLLRVDEYKRLLRERDPHAASVFKRRYRFAYGDKHFTLELFRPFVCLLDTPAVVSVESMGADDTIQFPPGWKVREVTEDEPFLDQSFVLERETL